MNEIKRSDLLPEIFFDETLESKSDEQFQNTVLRAICKFQNAHLIAISQKACVELNPLFLQLTLPKKKTFLTALMQKNSDLKQLLIGLIVGFMEPDQLDYYLQNKASINKRILRLIEKRLMDQL